jgi:Holliday junction resolvase
MSGERRGRSRELRVADVLRLEGWVAYRVPQPSAADVVALKAGHAPLLVQVKSTSGSAYERFGPADRRALAHEAIAAGADAALAWWPKGGPLTIIYGADWPGQWPNFGGHARVLAGVAA